MQHAERPGADGQADLVLRGGAVLALDDADTRGTAIAVRRGRVVELGDDASVERVIGSDTRVVDLAGRAVMPGINDSHLHACWLGAIWPTTFFGGGDPAQGAAEASVDPHTAGAAAPLLSSRAERRAAILRAGELIASLGITSYTEPGIGPGEDRGETGCFGQDVFDAYFELDAERALRARVNVLALFGVLDGPSRLEEFGDGLNRLVRETAHPERLRLAGVKIFGDGIPPMLQAWTRHDYPDGSHGGLLVEGADPADRERRLRAMIRLAHDAGLQVGVHATGDLTIDTVVDEVALAVARTPADLRHYVIHGDLATPAAVARLAEAGMGLNLQAGIAAATSGWLEGVLGAEVTRAAWPIAEALRAGVLSLSSDAPILAPDWRHGVAAADAWLGTPASDAERVARMGALLRAYTVAPARQDLAEGWKGTLAPGMVADLVVLERDPFDVSPAELPEVGIDLTVVDGDIVYERATAAIG
ncbi:amidohydrolase [Agromyces italicus]|uniref:amidohydrolase n=1 Tax=Agromyces italicus TaxID=279572 RepID=UPI0003B30DF9|nr:amidohydrolase family protein [Agromyces italicus]